MIVTVLWEDQRGVTTKGFGPHEVLVSCLSDDSSEPSGEIARRIVAIPKKGVGNVWRELKQRAALLSKKGPVIAVVDWDRVHELWKHASDQPERCKLAIRGRFQLDAPGDYKIVFLVDNVESLLEAACDVLDKPRPEGKPSPEERDRILARLAWGDVGARRRVREQCASFDYLVRQAMASLGNR